MPSARTISTVSPTTCAPPPPGKRFLFRCAASLLTALARLPPQPCPPRRMRDYVRHGHPGAVIVGSHVPKTTRQLAALLKQPGVAPIEIDVNRLPQQHDALRREDAGRGRRGASRGQHTRDLHEPDGTAVCGPGGAPGIRRAGLRLPHGRGARPPRDAGLSDQQGRHHVQRRAGHGLALRTARLLGQILPGVSVVRCPADHPRYPDMPVVIFPGNVGGDEALATVDRDRAWRIRGEVWPCYQSVGARPTMGCSRLTPAPRRRTNLRHERASNPYPTGASPRKRPRGLCSERLC